MKVLKLSIRDSSR